MGDHIIYGPNWESLKSEKVSLNHHTGKTGTSQDFLRQIRIYGDPLWEEKYCEKKMYRGVSVKFNIFPLLPILHTFDEAVSNHRILRLKLGLQIISALLLKR